MTLQDHTSWRKIDADGLDFVALRRAGVDLLQKLSKEHWTDFNAHDPGVTLLEVLCFGITDLAYRSDFDVVDYLADTNGSINYALQALFPPQDIFPNHAVTERDFCKLIYDRIPSIDDVWIRQTLHEEQMTGLFSVFIKPHVSLFKDEEVKFDLIRKDVIALLSEQRNLCSDVEHIHIVHTVAYSLSGQIEVDDSRPLAEIYADIYFQCAKLISSGSRIRRFEDVLGQGMAWEDLLEGPLTTHGYIDETDFARTDIDRNNSSVDHKNSSQENDLLKLITKVLHIPGVVRVANLQLLNAEGQTVQQLNIDDVEKTCPVLQFPNDPARIHDLGLVYRETPINGNHTASQLLQRQSLRQKQNLTEQVALHLKKMDFQHQAFRNNHANLDRLLVLPQGVNRDFSEYLSIGEQLPAIYGINHFGVPSSEPAEVHARAAQLKAYLFPFEQMMANYLTSLNRIADLYSVDMTLDKTYFSKLLTEREIPNIQKLYSATASANEVAKILQTRDQFFERRNRVLDSLLALYGEVFPSEKLRRFDYYHQDQFEMHLIHSKIRLLTHICTLSGQRAKGLNLQDEALVEGNFAPIQHRIQLLIGSSAISPGVSLAGHFKSNNYQLLSAKRYVEKMQAQINCPVDISYDETAAIVVPSEEPQSPIPSPSLPRQILCVELLHAGIRLEHFRKLPAGEKHAWLCLECEHTLWPLILLPNEEVDHYAVKLQSDLVDLNQCSEGFHILEHVLLRPRNVDQMSDFDAEFFCHRVSIVLPAFTARFSDKGFQLWLEELISQHLPAHILVDFYWLDFPFFAQFELRYHYFLEQLRLYSNQLYPLETPTLDDAAAELKKFIEHSRRLQQRNSHTTTHYF
ncbi:hypothetical protein [Undibacterium flavidum]|uniref:Uncharacterized protein n=1 Tax=Undibacterium flavidum TaxID=2762297 RepID=A0ABR6YFC6_9BURK|nr:hypothetical protein [Undibacterium flavidum]MBC3875289.1 hypothetical protein [Undibacterium flavidum]